MNITLDTYGEFTWNFGALFHIATEIGNFEWSDPDYGGDNTVRATKPYDEWIQNQNLQYGRDKGFHTIREYCGPNVRIIQ